VRPGSGGWDAIHRFQVPVAAGVLVLLAGCAEPRHAALLGGVGTPLNTGQHDRIEADSARKPAVSIAYGIIPPWVRAEAELAWRWSGLHGYNHGRHEESATGNVHVFALMGNAWLQPPLPWRIMPYAGGGIGPALQIREGRSSITRTDLDEVSGVFAWQVGGGLRIGIGERLSVDLGVRHFEAGNVEQQLVLAGLVLVLAP
jgi:opacity protein-like surface antigen